MKTFLLLAGQSKRFWPLTEKTLFPICGKTLLEHQVERLRAGGCEDIVLVGGAHNLTEAGRIFPDLATVEQEELQLGMQGAVQSILKAYPDEPLMIVGGNDVVEPRAYAELLASKGDGALLAYTVENYFPGGYLSVDGDRVTGIVEKPGAGNEPSNLVNIVAHLHRDPTALRVALDAVQSTRDDGYEQALATLFNTKDYRAIAYTGAWRAVKYPWHLLPLAELLLSELSDSVIHPSAEIHPSATIIGNVIIEEGVKVMPNAVIRGPATIGKNTVVANNALVRDSSVGNDCVVGFSTEVKCSVLHSHVWTHMNYVGDSVIGRNVSLGGGTITGNLRLDEGEILAGTDKIPTGLTKFGAAIGDDCRIGIHVSLAPGVRIGKGSFVGSAAMVEADLADKSFARMKNGILDVRPNTSATPQPEARNVFRGEIQGKTS